MKASGKFYLTAIPAMFVIALTLNGCGGASNDKQANEAAADSINQLAVSPETNNLLYQFPTPFEVTTMLEKAKAGFIFDITNPPANVTKYATEKSKALNLGVFSADLAYSATYNRIDETNKFLAVTSKLADELGIAGVYDNTMMEKVKKFNNNKDSLVGMIRKVFGNTNDYLSKNNRNQVSVLVATGGFIESLYLSTALNMVAKDNKQISTLIFNQKGNFDKLMTILEAYKSDSSIMQVNNEVGKLKAVFTDYGLEADKKMPKEKAAQLNTLVEGVRNSFVN